MKTSLERIYPNNIHIDDIASQSSLNLHLERYNFASKHLNGNSILDIACGCGYGTAMMAETHPDKQFIGVDIDPEAINYAMQHYPLANLNYICSSAEEFSPICLFDTVISLETIEHLANPKKFIETTAQKLLKPGGHIIASVPITPTKDGNPHHLHDFTKNSFLTMFKNIKCNQTESFEQVQHWFSKKPKHKVTKKNMGNKKMKIVIKNIFFHYIRHPFDIVNRGTSIVKHGLCNKYLTVCFIKSR